MNVQASEVVEAFGEQGVITAMAGADTTLTGIAPVDD